MFLVILLCYFWCSWQICGLYLVSLFMLQHKSENMFFLSVLLIFLFSVSVPVKHFSLLVFWSTRLFFSSDMNWIFGKLTRFFDPNLRAKKKVFYSKYQDVNQVLGTPAKFLTKKEHQSYHFQTVIILVHYFFFLFHLVFLQSVLHHQKFYCKRDFVFLVIYHGTFDAQCKFVRFYIANLFMLQHDFLHIFFICDFGFYFQIFDVFVFIFAIYNLQWYFWCLMQSYLNFQDKSCVSHNKTHNIVWLMIVCLYGVGLNKRFRLIFWISHKDNSSCLMVGTNINNNKQEINHIQKT